MRIRTKIIGLITILMTVLSGTLLLMVNISSRNQTKEEIKNIRLTEMDKAKMTLQNYVDMAYMVVENNISESVDPVFIEKRFGKELNDIIDIAQSLIEVKIRQVNNSELSLNNAQKEIINDLKQIRFDNGIGYIWITDKELPLPRFIMHPLNTSLDGMPIDEKNFGNNSKIFRKFVKKAEEKGEGYILYDWPKPDNKEEIIPKLSYVREIKEWNWVLGTGIFTDEAVKRARTRTLETIRSMRYDEGTGYFWINDTERPFPKMVMHATVPDLEGQVLDDKKYNVAFGRDKNLFQAFVDAALDSGRGYVDYPWPKPTQEGLTEDQPKLSYVRYIPQWNWVLGSGFYIDDIEKKVQASQTRLEEQLKSLTLQVIILTGSLLILIFILAGYVIKMIINPIKESTHMLSDMAEGQGDLTRRLDAMSRDEMGSLAEKFNTFIEKLCLIVIQIKNTTKETLQVKENLNITTNATSGEIDEIGRKIEEIHREISTLNTSINETDTTAGKIYDKTMVLDSHIDNEASAIEESSAAINQMVSSINSVAQITQSKSDAVKKLLVTTQNGSIKMDDTTTAIEAVNSNIDNIQEMVNFINNIADQTNLLAMNAAIEAAQAGEAGKGFSVVSDEIRKLAETSSDNVSTISTVLREVLSTIQKATEDSRETREIFIELNKEVHEVSSALNEILSATLELSTGGKEILDAISMLNDISVKVRESSEEMRSSTLDMKNSMKEANTVSDRVNNAIREIKKGSEEISGAIDTLSTYIAALSQTSEKLKGEVSKFKTE